MNDSITRILSQVYKNLNSLRRNTFRMADVLIWPMIFLFTLTFFITYLGSDTSYLYVVILGMIGWRVIYFLNLDMVSSIAEENWAKTLAYLFASPISRMETAVGSAISGFVKACFVLVVYLLLTNLLYGFVVKDWGVFVLGMATLSVAGFTMGLFALSFAYFAKEEAFSISFILPDVFALLSGVYFSIDAVYPSWLLPFIRLLPTTQGFEVLKSTVGLGHPDLSMLVLTTGGWLLVAYLVNGWAYDKARKEGKLARLG